MGNQSSKQAGSSSNGPSRPGRRASDGLESYPSFSKSDTKESSRSLRGSIRSKIPGSSRAESPRRIPAPLPKQSTPGTPPAEEPSTLAVPLGAETAPADLPSRLPFRNRPPHSPPPLDPSRTDASRGPPSPNQLAGAGEHRAHQSVEHARQSGEVGTVSDAPPTATAQSAHAHLKQPKESILLKKDNVATPIVRESLATAPADDGATPSSPAMGIGALRSIDLDEMITRLLDAAYAGKVTKTVCLKNAEITAICAAAREVFLSQPALLELSPPVKIVGDVHGQYTDLIRLFEMCGFPPYANYLFLGDYVDRGKQSLETILLLLCYKLKFPENFFLLRGNHECANVTRVYGFYDECKRRCNIKIWKTFVDTFNCLPIAAIVASKIFCVHGGLSPSLSHMDDIRQIARPTDVPDYGLLNDLLWSDPADMDTDWESNERGVSYCFGKTVIQNFLQRHDFDLVCRAHMVVEDGYEFFSDRILVTVFSAPNYCGEFDNWGAVMSVSDELLCSFELLKPLDSSALKSHIKKSRNRRNSTLNSPPASVVGPQSV
ncbi:MAG: hypothetical protein M1826_001525 [Phylliscum demangeonii]|nr:MAG: hypothetical protein M1826_001525 [Phylliscum demangeonii]